MLYSEFSDRSHKRQKKWHWYFVVTCLAVAIWLFGNSVYIHAKAEVAQLLIAKSWQKTMDSGESAAPWPWADTWPIAEIHFMKQNKRYFVLAGATESIIAFGPGHLIQSAFPGQNGNAVIIGHRDTHFASLEQVQLDDMLEVNTQHGRSLFKVTQIRVAHESQMEMINDSYGAQLTLITCYPFREVSPDTPYRLVVKAEAL